MNMKKMKKYIKNHNPVKKFYKGKKCWYKNPIVVIGIIVLSAAILATLVIGLVKWFKRDEELLEDDWMLDDEDDDLFFFPEDGDDAFEMEDEEGDE
ncbi:MAG: hypothetical protein FWC69_01860 [Defluviitaleaceae bacterium]|nr:hypothetical protein [Defluviitaleaceae bacterium]